MRKAAKPPHDVAVVLRLLQVPPAEADAKLHCALLGRASTREEADYLANGGYTG